ncbi:MAG TPA: NAD-dependent malic enzyme, partial [Pseudoalteromonas sp.]|nr:NAD-dependent malic enzyme [Pseudoalteromonas sp.]
EQIISQMVFEGISEAQARSQVFMVDRFGLLTEGMEGLRDFQQALAQPQAALSEWTYSGEYASLLDVMHCAAPDILIGVSGQPGLFTEQVIRAMHSGCEQPIIFPLSNPSKQVEAHPADVIKWTEGKALVATGSPFEPVEFNGEVFPIPQCNNSYIFPGIGLGVIAAKATRITDAMLSMSSEMLAESSPRANTGKGSLLPALTEIETLSKRIAFAVAKKAIEEGVALEISDDALWAAIDRNYWLPKYRNYKRCSI